MRTAPEGLQGCQARNRSTLARDRGVIGWNTRHSVRRNVAIQAGAAGQLQWPASHVVGADAAHNSVPASNLSNPLQSARILVIVARHNIAHRSRRDACSAAEAG